MQEKSPALRPLASYGVLVVNALLLGFLAWHLAFEAVPGAVTHFRASLSVEGRALAMVVLLPYVLVLMYLARRVRRCVFEWKTAAAVAASMIGHIALVIAVTSYAAWNFLPD